MACVQHMAELFAMLIDIYQSGSDLTCTTATLSWLTRNLIGPNREDAAIGLAKRLIKVQRQWKSNLNLDIIYSVAELDPCKKAYFAPTLWVKLVTVSYKLVIPNSLWMIERSLTLTLRVSIASSEHFTHFFSFRSVYSIPCKKVYLGMQKVLNSVRRCASLSYVSLY